LYGHDYRTAVQVILVSLREIAPEFYNTLTWHTSWCWIIFKFLTDPEVGPWTRVKRHSREEPKKAAKIELSPAFEPSSPIDVTAFADVTNITPSGRGMKTRSAAKQHASQMLVQ